MSKRITINEFMEQKLDLCVIEEIDELRFSHLRGGWNSLSSTGIDNRLIQLQEDICNRIQITLGIDND